MFLLNKGKDKTPTKYDVNKLRRVAEVTGSAYAVTIRTL